MRYFTVFKTALLALTLFLVSCDDQEKINQEMIQAKNKPQEKLTVSEESAKKVINDYAYLVYEMFSDATLEAKNLQQAIDVFVKNPSPATQFAAKQAWLKARIPYLQAESSMKFIFAHGFLGDINVVLQEELWRYVLLPDYWSIPNIALIDYVAEDLLPPFNKNIINTDLPLQNLGLEINNSEKHVMRSIWGDEPQNLQGFTNLPKYSFGAISGYHTIEFLLWGQDLYDNTPGAGMRSFTDYVTDENCTNGNCARRAEYLQKVASALVTQLENTVRLWQRFVFVEAQNLEPQELLVIDHFINIDDKDLSSKFANLNPISSLNNIYLNLGYCAFGLFHDRLHFVLKNHLAEDEIDVFSNNTHNSLYYNVLGIKSFYLGYYQKSNGEVISGASLSSLVAEVAPEIDEQMRTDLDNALNSMQIIVDNANNGQHFDQLIAEGNSYGNQVIKNASASLEKLVLSLENTAKALGLINFEVTEY